MRIDLGKVGGDEGFFRELDVLFAFKCRCGGIGGCCRGEELPGLYGSVADLFDELDDIWVFVC